MGFLITWGCMLQLYGFPYCMRLHAAIVWVSSLHEAACCICMGFLIAWGCMLHLYGFSHCMRLHAAFVWVSLLHEAACCNCMGFIIKQKSFLVQRFNSTALHFKHVLATIKASSILYGYRRCGTYRSVLLQIVRLK